jgi:hypothetical protein
MGVCQGPESLHEAGIYADLLSRVETEPCYKDGHGVHRVARRRTALGTDRGDDGRWKSTSQRLHFINAH